ncbi:kinase-like protein, partial [Rickenella mellea]
MSRNAAPRRRLVSGLDSSSASVNDKSRPSDPNQEHAVCAKFVTTNKQGRREVVLLSLDRPVSIGRNPSLCTYVINNAVVSNVHCKLYAVLSSTGGVIISCQDLSTNGLVLNGHKLRKSWAIVVDGDVIEIPSSQAFKCIQVMKEPRQKAHIFEPTPPRGSTYKNLKVGKYTIMSHCLGSGTFATVHLAIDTEGHRQIACKTIMTKSNDKQEMHKVMKEVQIMRGLDHPNINRVWDVEVNERNAWLHIFLELCAGGDLFTYITSHKQSDGRLCEGEAKYIMFQVLKGLKYLHDRLISHRDLKPENILLHAPGPYPRVQIADFGLARPKAYQETLNVCGTVAYLPPEGILALDRRDLGYVGMPADCWSSGVVLYTMLSGTHPFDYREDRGDGTESSWFSNNTCPSQISAVGENVIKSRIVNGEVEFEGYIWDPIPKAKMLVGKLLIHNYRLRETVYGAMKDEWIVSDLEELEAAYRERIGS